jgi:hypothetical protein
MPTWTMSLASRLDGGLGAASLVTNEAGSASSPPLMNSQTIYLSFWHIEMSNLPVGTFRRRVLLTAEARSMLESARASGTLVCVAKGDLGAPYGERDRERHTQLCAALREHAGIEVELEDFFGDNCANPLCFAEIGKEGSLIVVDCHYAYDPKLGLGKMNIAPDSIQFNVFEHLEPMPSAGDVNL